jgi:ABC-type lipoprotein release transport system permease subunit
VRELALLKTLGFTRRQTRSTIAWQATVSVALGAVIGVPLGLFVGRLLWIQFADEIHVVPRTSIPSVTIMFIVFGSLLLANLIAALPGRRAARTPPALVLRAD